MFGAVAGGRDNGYGKVVKAAGLSCEFARVPASDGFVAAIQRAVKVTGASQAS